MLNDGSCIRRFSKRMKHHPQKADKQPLPSRLFRSIAGIWSSRAYGDCRCLHGFSYRARCPDRLLSRQHDPGAERWQGLRRRDRCVCPAHAEYHSTGDHHAGAYRSCQGGNRLSGGEKQRIALARSISQGTDVLFFDEVTSARPPPRGTGA